ncbi:hypothetical protein [Cryobacterium sp. TMT1-19]|uniref:hypothetical protein n=1 Tax=Cryobacterium sp. TMT1-19 TaxID=1259231 RepID=UPI00141BB09C|nr:hypothetical protein [Cryobacterium sp. TMT1-19]
MTTPLRVEDAAPVTTTEQARDRVADLVRSVGSCPSTARAAASSSPSSDRAPRR